MCVCVTLGQFPSIVRGVGNIKVHPESAVISGPTVKDSEALLDQTTKLNIPSHPLISPTEAEVKVKHKLRPLPSYFP